MGDFAFNSDDESYLDDCYYEVIDFNKLAEEHKDTKDPKFEEFIDWLNTDSNETQNATNNLEDLTTYGSPDESNEIQSLHQFEQFEVQPNDVPENEFDKEVEEVVNQEVNQFYIEVEIVEVEVQTSESSQVSDSNAIVAPKRKRGRPPIADPEEKTRIRREREKKSSKKYRQNKKAKKNDEMLANTQMMTQLEPICDQNQHNWNELIFDAKNLVEHVQNNMHVFITPQRKKLTQNFMDNLKRHWN